MIKQTKQKAYFYLFIFSFYLHVFFLFFLQKGTFINNYR